MDDSPKSPFNGKSLAGLTGARIRTVEEIRVPLSSLDSLKEHIRALNGTGSLTINFHHGKENGDVEWKGSKK